MLTALTATTAAQTLSLNTISTIAKSDPLVITGAIGTQNTYRYSSYGTGYASPVSNSLYANLKAKTIHLVSQMRGQGLSAGHQGQPRTQSFPECICRSGAFSALSP